MSQLTEIQKAIEELAPEEKEELRDWLDERDDELEKEWAKVAAERLRGIQAGERKTIDASDVLAEARRMRCTLRLGKHFSSGTHGHSGTRTRTLWGRKSHKTADPQRQLS
jgi:ribosomal protein L11 methylase PrmA